MCIFVFYETTKTLRIDKNHILFIQSTEEIPVNRNLLSDTDVT